MRETKFQPLEAIIHYQTARRLINWSIINQADTDRCLIHCVKWLRVPMFYVFMEVKKKKKIPTYLFGVFIRKLTSTSFNVQIFNNIRCNESCHCYQQVELPGLSISINSLIHHDTELAVPGSVIIFVLISVIIYCFLLFFTILISLTIP